jgi:hypothetical protein
MESWILAVDVRAASATAAVRSAERTWAVVFPQRALSFVVPAGPVPGDLAMAEQTYTAILNSVAHTVAPGREPVGPSRLRLTHPAWWGPDDLTVLARASEAAALPPPQFIPTPVAAAWHLTPDTRPGGLVAVLNGDGDTLETAVLRRSARGFTLVGASGLTVDPDDPQALTNGIDELLITISRAGLPPDRIEAVHIVGDAARLPRFDALVAETLGVPTFVAAEPEMATALGALTADER